MWRYPRVLNVFLSSMCPINLTPLASVSSPKGNHSALTDKIGRPKEWCLSSLPADWLITVCHSHLGDTLLSAAKLQVSTQKPSGLTRLVYATSRTSTTSLHTSLAWLSLFPWLRRNTAYSLLTINLSAVLIGLGVWQCFNRPTLLTAS